jgi:hypothetical protein
MGRNLLRTAVPCPITAGARTDRKGSGGLVEVKKLFHGLIELLAIIRVGHLKAVVVDI